MTFGEDDKRKLLGCVIIQNPKLPECSQAAMSFLAGMAGVDVPGCNDPECDHRAIPDGYFHWLPGTPVLTAIEDISKRCE